MVEEDVGDDAAATDDEAPQLLVAGKGSDAVQYIAAEGKLQLFHCFGIGP